VFAKELLIVRDANVVIDDDVFVDERRRRKWERRLLFLFVYFMGKKVRV
jgi:hypothetical protein